MAYKVQGLVSLLSTAALHCDDVNLAQHNRIDWLKAGVSPVYQCDSGRPCE